MHVPYEKSLILRKLNSACFIIMAVCKRRTGGTRGSCCWEVVEAGSRQSHVWAWAPKRMLSCHGESLFSRYEAKSKSQDVLHATTGLNAIECGKVGHRVEHLHILGDACGMNTEDLKCFFLYWSIVDIECHMIVQYSDATSLYVMLWSQI